VLPSAQLVLAYERGELPTRAFSPGAILAFMSWITEQPSATFPAEGDTQEMEGFVLRGRGCAPPTVRLPVWALFSFETALGVHSNTTLPAIRNRQKSLQKSWHSVGAPFYDVVEVRSAR
jgi:hypothetical protein